MASAAEGGFRNADKGGGLTPVYKHHNITIRLTIQHKAALTTCKHK